MENQDPMVVDPANGVVRGDSKEIPNAGTSRGFVDVGRDTYGADLGVNATNRRGSAHTAPDPMFETTPQGGGDFSRSGHNSPEYGRGMGGAADSDPKDDCYPDDQRQ